ncbi:site-specific integrase [Kurthia zopfii]|uniref:Integrase n=1 Tax=Kurthia zopfii TaxID=1650 RepID=A0A8B4QDL0_9BACL|nr:site-specific integrase [Kurthia zopfii]PWI22731.1 site-specific integrase [Kurthia zopfii]TDR39532.1 site-specific recombinase XerD [Kurthia zopfii]GEK32104.1 site-specific integrase [Kurthia zopfii]STX10841.1 Integrase [Kurthia zopfii]
MAYINQDTSSWYFVVSNGKDPLTNKPRQIKRRGFKTRDDAELAALEVELQIKRGDYFQGENMKFQALYEEWIETYPFTRKKSSTRNRISSAKHLLNVWAQTPINKITKQVYRQYMNSLVTKYMLNTREGIHIVAKMIFDHAVEMEYIKKNPTINYKLPKNLEYEENEEKLVFLEKEELKLFLQLAKDEGLTNDYEFFSLLAYSGMRIGEAVSLQWKDLDFKSSSLSITKTYYNPSNNKRNFELQTPKTRSSMRKILIDPSIMDLLKDLKEKQNQFIKKNKRLYKDQGFIFTCSEGYPCTIKQFSDRLKRIIKKMDNLNKHITPHSFRHTHASLLIEANVNMKVISHRLGHSSVATTDEIYGHLTRGLEKEASQKFSELMRDLQI